MTLKERIQLPTPPFYKKVRNTGLVLAAIGSALLAAPVALPTMVLQAAGYLTVAGSVASGISQTVTNDVHKPKRKRHGSSKRS